MDQENPQPPSTAFRHWLHLREFDAKRDQGALRVLWFIGFVFLAAGLPMLILLKDPLPLIGAILLLSLAYKTHQGFKNTGRKNN